MRVPQQVMLAVVLQHIVTCMQCSQRPSIPNHSWLNPAPTLVVVAQCSAVATIATFHVVDYLEICFSV